MASCAPPKWCAYTTDAPGRPSVRHELLLSDASLCKVDQHMVCHMMLHPFMDMLHSRQPLDMGPILLYVCRTHSPL
jgi:hypothetical protein